MGKRDMSENRKSARELHCKAYRTVVQEDGSRMAGHEVATHKQYQALHGAQAAKLQNPHLSLYSARNWASVSACARRSCSACGHRAMGRMGWRDVTHR